MINDMNKIYILSAVLLVFTFSSCVQTNKLYLFDDQKPSVQQLDSIKSFAIQRIYPADRITITISSTDPALTSYLNPFNLQMSQSNSSQQINSGFLVGPEGAIEFPLLGKVPVAGLTTAEAATLIKERLSYYYKDLFVNVNLNGRVFFISGRQGTPIQMYNERLTIFEALSQSGVQDAFDMKNQLWLVREDSGQRYFVNLNLNSKKIFESPYYFLHNNDVIYLKPGKYASVLSPSSPARGIITLAGTLAALIIAIKSL